MRDKLLQHINHEKFPCIMAKALLRKGHLKTCEVDSLDNECESILRSFYQFIDCYRQNKNNLHSFIIILKNKMSFAKFEEEFWRFLRELNFNDKKQYAHASNVSSNPHDPDFSYSIGEEAFFILALHPESPRFARRSPFPAIVFNPHEQFNDLRMKGVYDKVKNIIRKRDFELQQKTNPMLSDFGEASEVYQYTGCEHLPSENIPDKLGGNYEYHQST